MNELTKLAIQIGQAVVKATRESADEIGELGKDIILKRTKAGRDAKGLLKRLRPSTIERRGRTELAGDTSPGTSNLTEKGKMLNSIEVVKKIKPKRTTLTIQADNVKDRNKTRGHARSGRKYLDFNSRDDQRLTNVVAKNIVDAINKIKIG